MKRILSMLLCISIITSMLLVCLPMSVSAESLYIRKIVSVVYDDSGSMSSSGCVNWAYANYALQSFCGLLNSDDQLYVTYMSEAEKNSKLNPPGIDLGASAIQQSVDSIRKHVQYGNTPYSSIDIAFKKLQNTKDSNVNTQYWLVVITDGEFQVAGGNVSEPELTSKLNSCVSTKMPNGSTPQISYLAIGNDVTKPKKNEDAGLFVYESSGAEDIVNTMSAIADKVSGRSRLDPQDIKKVDSKTIEIKSAVPLLNIAVLAQKTTAKIASAAGTNSKLTVAKSASISYPERSGWTTDQSLTGGAFLISNGDKNIEAGTYQIKFDSDINLNNVVIMFEPALEIRMTVKQNGTEVKDLSKLSASHENDKVEVSCKIFEIGTNNEISPSLLPQDTVYKLSIIENGSEVQACSTSEMSIGSYDLHNAKTEIKASVHIIGFNPITLSTGEFTPGKALHYTIDVEQPDNFSLTMAQLKENTEKIKFTVYANGIPLDKKAVQDLNFSIDTKMPGKIEFEPDGKISFMPIYQDPVTTIPTGDVEVTGSIQDLVSKTTSFYIKPLEYQIKWIDTENPTVVRTELGKNTKGVRFELYVDGEKLDKEAVEAADLQYSLNSQYTDKVQLESQVDDSGTITVIPKSDKWSWTAAYSIPTGTMEITTSLGDATATGKVNVTSDKAHELLWNWIVPILIFLLLLGEIFKRRFKYSSKIHYNHGESAGTTVTGPKNGWNTSGLFSITALIPFIPDVKVVNGAKFYARGFLWNSTVIGVKTSQHPPFSGTMDGGVNELESVRFSKNDVNEFEEGEKRRDMIPGNVLVTSADRNYRSCQIYLYSDN